MVHAAAAAAAARGLEGRWVITNTRSSMDPFLTFSDRRDLREKALKMWSSRGDVPGPRDNNPNITHILRLRVEKARLLGYPTFAHWVADGQMAKTPDAAMTLLKTVWTPAVKRAREEIVDVPGDGGAGRPQRADRGLGRPLLRREGSQGEVRPRR